MTDEVEDCQRPNWRDQMARSLAHQFKRQSRNDMPDLPKLAHSVVDHVCDVMQAQRPRTAVDDFLVVCEFFARETRAFKLDADLGRSASIGKARV